MNLKPIPKLALAQPPYGLPGLIYLGCGCRGQAGHYFFLPGMRNLYSAFPEVDRLNRSALAQLDGAFAPQDTTNEGEAWFHTDNVNGIRYMVISFWDRSVDERHGSNSTFLLIGEAKSFNEAIAECRAAFPEVFNRFKFEIKLRRNMFI